jgi:hypothetical protein
MQNLASFDALLKDVYRGPIVELLNQELYMITWVQQQSVNDLGTFTGRRFIFPVHTGRNRGRGATTDGGALVKGGQQSALDGIEGPKYLNQGIELSDMVIQQSKSDEGAFVRALEFEMNGAMQDMRKDASRMAYGTGDGLLATCAAGGPATTFSVDNGQYIAVGDTIDLIDKGTGTPVASGTGLVVTGVAYTGTAGSATQANATITTAQSVTVTATTGVYLSGDRNNESNGLRNICSTARTLHNINSVTNPIWDGNVLNAGQANPAEDTFMQLAQRARQRGSQPVERFVTTLGVQRRLANTYQSAKRFNDAHAQEIDGGYSAINVAAGNTPVPVVSDVDAVNGTAFGLNSGSLSWAQVGPPDWLEAPDGQGSVLHLKDGSSAGTKVAVWQAWIMWYAQLICVAPNRNGMITNINDDIPVARV